MPQRERNISEEIYFAVFVRMLTVEILSRTVTLLEVKTCVMSRSQRYLDRFSSEIYTTGCSKSNVSNVEAYCAAAVNGGDSILSE